MALPVSETLEGWNKRWEEGKSAWHKTAVDPVLEKRIGLLEECGGEGPLSVLVTMCGKSVDLLWLCSRGHTVVGVESSALAVSQFFTDNSIPYTVKESGPFSVYTASDQNIRVFCGNIFEFGPSVYSGGEFDVIWDCNAIVAVNEADHARYVELLVSLLKKSGRILMTTWTYEKGAHMNFPLCMPPERIRELFDTYCDVSLVEDIDMSESDLLKRHNLSWATRPIFLLTKK